MSQKCPLSEIKKGRYTSPQIVVISDGLLKVAGLTLTIHYQQHTTRNRVKDMQKPNRAWGQAHQVEPIDQVANIDQDKIQATIRA